MTSVTQRGATSPSVRVSSQPDSTEVDLRDLPSSAASPPAPRGVEELLRGVLASLEPLAPMELRLMEALGCTLADTVPPVSAVLGHQDEREAHIDDVLPAGLQLTPAHLALLASRGYERVMARPRPRVVVVSLAPLEGVQAIPEVDPEGSDELAFNEPDINGYLLAAAAQAAGGLAFRAGWVAPTPGRLREAVDNELLRADLVIISGATDRAIRSRVELELGQLGWVGYTNVAIDPGHVQGLGRVGSQGCPVFLLAQDPVEAYVSFEAVVRPVIRYLLGTTAMQRPLVTARCSRRLDVVSHSCAYVPARLEQDEQGGAVVTPLRSPLSSPVEELAGANALILVQEGTTAVKAGESVTVALLD